MRMLLAGWVALRKELGWAHIYQYIQAKWAWSLPYVMRPKEGQGNQPKTNGQRQPDEDTTVWAPGEIMRD